MKVGVVDMGTNSMRLLISGGDGEVGRWVEVTGLGAGVDESGVLSQAAISRTLEVLSRFGRLMSEHDVDARKAIATSASRDAANRDEFFDLAGQALGVRPTLITGDQEARYAFTGAVAGIEDHDGLIVSDIGGGSTEFVDEDRSISIDIGSVRLTDRALPDRPPTEGQLDEALSLIRESFQPVDLDAPEQVAGIAGTWTSLAAIELDLPEYDRSLVHGYRMERDRLEGITGWLSGLTLDETEAIPSLDPKRASVILAGALIACAVLETVALETVTISEMDTLDGVAAEMLDLR